MIAKLLNFTLLSCVSVCVAVEPSAQMVRFFFAFLCGTF